MINIPSPDVAKMKECLLCELGTRFGDIEKHPVINQAVLLDPRFKQQGFGNDDRRKDACKALKEKVRSMTAISSTSGVAESNESAAQSTPSTSTASSSLWFEFEEENKKLTGDTNPTVVSIIEVDKYLAEPLLPRHLNPLTWWTERRAIYPHLYELMTRRLCIMATSVPCERVFSTAGHLFNEKRTRLKSSKLSELIFLQKNLE
ncbi:E3 SUMO-protein ligase ZBED1-like [Zophobas morio]|uniref:E3 SUMO-protein ligase ZBED1-like n=1 Tax=Zophobas morio TaxID=2755281 RepID=UPI003083BD5C